MGCRYVVISTYRYIEISTLGKCNAAALPCHRGCAAAFFFSRGRAACPAAVTNTRWSCRRWLSSCSQCLGFSVLLLSYRSWCFGSFFSFLILSGPAMCTMWSGWHRRWHRAEYRRIERVGKGRGRRPSSIQQGLPAEIPQDTGRECRPAKGFQRWRWPLSVAGKPACRRPRG